MGNDCNFQRKFFFFFSFELSDVIIPKWWQLLTSFSLQLTFSPNPFFIDKEKQNENSMEKLVTKKVQVNTPFCIWIWLYSLSLMFFIDNLLDWMTVSNCLQMHARQRILTNGSFKDGIEIDTKWVVTVTLNQERRTSKIWCLMNESSFSWASTRLYHFIWNFLN